ncbi:MAG: Penicillin-binding protein 1C [Legionellaceae bacterium]
MFKIVKKLILTLLLSIFIVGIIYFFLPKPPLLETISFSQRVYAEKHQLLYLTLTQDQKYRLFTPLNTISPKLINAVLLQEDQYFFTHPGFNPWSILRAFWISYVMQKRRVGGSTITMQVVRLSHHFNTKTIKGKLTQLFKAIQLERHYSKQEILEAYLSLAPYGSNIEGISTASLVYFNKSAMELTLPEALTLSVIPQNPLRRYPQIKHLQELKKIRNRLFKRWIKVHPEDQNKQSLMKLPLTLNSHFKLPHLAMHLVNKVLEEDKRHSVINTTLNLSIQTLIEKTATNYLSRQSNIGVENLSIMLIDSHTMSVKALVGSANFFNQGIAGQVNGTLAKRSPGSALKPFIYALAFDQGLIHPYTILKDAPHRFGAYNPENFDNEFMGPIRAIDALILSRNIPAVYLTEQLHNPTFYDFLIETQVKELKPSSFYGLAIALGGIEVTMEELMQLYALLPNLGNWKPLRYTENQAFEKGKQVLSPEAAYLTLDMLQKNSRPSFFQPKIPIAWKTGTSSAFRDAWSIGIFGDYILAIWVGNFNGNGNPALVGKKIAAPLMLQIIDAISTQQGGIKPLTITQRKLNLIKIPVCAASGMLPTRYCKQTVLTWFIPGKSPIKRDTIFREIMIDGASGLRSCHIDKNTQFKIYEFWPTDLLKIYRSAGIQRLPPPPYKKECQLLEQNVSGVNPYITSPQEEYIYTIDSNSHKHKKIIFLASADSDIKTIYWFLNEQYLGKTIPEEPFLWKAKPGHFIVRAVDEKGRSDAKNITVQQLS